MYAVKLVTQGSVYDRWLGADSGFAWNAEGAELFTTVSQALQAVHTRGYKAASQGWSTGSGRMELIEVENTPREKRVVS